MATWGEASCSMVAFVHSAHSMLSTRREVLGTEPCNWLAGSLKASYDHLPRQWTGPMLPLRLCRTCRMRTGTNRPPDAIDHVIAWVRMLADEPPTPHRVVQAIERRQTYSVHCRWSFGLFIIGQAEARPGCQLVQGRSRTLGGCSSLLVLPTPWMHLLLEGWLNFRMAIPRVALVIIHVPIGMLY